MWPPKCTFNYVTQPGGKCHRAGDRSTDCMCVCVCVRGSSLLCYLPLRFNRFCCLFVTFTFERLRPIWHSVRAESVGLYVKTKTAITEGPGVNPCSVTFPVRTDVILKCWTKRVLFLVFFFLKKGTWSLGAEEKQKADLMRDNYVSSYFLLLSKP